MTDDPVVTFSVTISPEDVVKSSVVVISADEVVKVSFSVVSSVLPSVTLSVVTVISISSVVSVGEEVIMVVVVPSEMIVDPSNETVVSEIFVDLEGTVTVFVDFDGEMVVVLMVSPVERSVVSFSVVVVEPEIVVLTFSSVVSDTVFEVVDVPSYTVVVDASVEPDSDTVLDDVINGFATVVENSETFDVGEVIVVTFVAGVVETVEEVVVFVVASPFMIVVFVSTVVVSSIFSVVFVISAFVVSPVGSVVTSVTVVTPSVGLFSVVVVKTDPSVR